MLAANGFKVDSTALKIIPIKMEYGNINSIQLDNVRNRTIEGFGSQPSGLTYSGGKITENLKRIIPAPISKTMIESTDLNEKIQKDLYHVFPKFETTSKKIPEESVLFERYKDSAVNGEYSYTDELTQKVVKVKSEEELRESIKDYVQRSKDAKSSKIIQLKSGLIDYINTNRTPDNLLNTKNSSYVTSNKILTSNFEKYMKKGSGWRVIDDIDELTNAGIIGFENTKTNILEFVSVTSETFTTPHTIGLNNHTVLGKFMDDDSARKYKVNIMESTVKNLEAMKLFIVLNNMPELFKNRKLGVLKVINYLGGQGEIVNLQNGLDNFNILANKGEMQNNFTNGQIKNVNFYDYIVGEVENVLLESDDRALKTIIDGSFNVAVGNNKKETLLNLRKILFDSYPHMLKGKTRTEKLTFNTDVEKISAFIS